MFAFTLMMAAATADKINKHLLVSERTEGTQEGDGFQSEKCNHVS